MRASTLQGRSVPGAADKVSRWARDEEYRGWEPFDGLSSPAARILGSSLFLRRVWQQVVRRSRLNLRPMLGIPTRESTKGRGYLAAGYLLRFRATGDEWYADEAVRCLNWLLENSSPRYRELSWGNEFDFASRAGELPAGEPIIVWTSLIGQAFLDGYETLGDERYLEAGRSICKWIVDLPREETSRGVCLSYVAFEQRSIHNSNLLGAAMLARTATLTGDRELMALARESIDYSCARQQMDGSWYYGEEERYHWIDSFHTGYNLDALSSFAASAGDARTWACYDRGLAYFTATFFTADGATRYYSDATYPVEIQCCAQAIETLANAVVRRPELMQLLKRVTDWTIGHMQDPAGFFYYRILRHGVSRTPMLHWGQATMFKALALVALQGGAR